MTTWTDLEGIILSEISQKGEYHMISPVYDLTKLIETEWISGFQGRGLEVSEMGKDGQKV